MKNKYTSGLTLIELLISIAIISVMLLTLGAFFSQNSQASLQMNARSDLQQEILNAQQLITGRLREAFYVLPPGTSSSTLVLTKNPTTSNAVPTYSNPLPGTRSKTSTWLIGTDPILAMILPPVTSSTPCTLSTTAGTATAQAANDGCYRFYAYYPVNRQVWISGTSSSNNPGADISNGNAWVLVQYMGYLSADFYAAAVTSINVSVPNVASYLNYNGASAQVLADYTEPTIDDATTTGLTNPNTKYTMFNYANSLGPITTSNLATPAKPVTTVTVNLAAARLVAGKLMRLPDATNEYSITVNLSNQGKVAAQ